MRPRVLHSVFGLILLLCLLVSHRHAHAFGEVTKKSQVGFEIAGNGYCNNVGSKFGKTAQAAAAAMADALNSSNCQKTGTLITVWGTSPCLGPFGDDSYRCPLTRNQCFKDPQTGTCTLPGPIEVEKLVASPKNSDFCPEYSSEKSGRCECLLGTKPSNSNDSCEPYSCPTGGSFTKVTQPDMKVAGVGAVCTGGCEVMPNSWSVAPDGSIMASWPFRYTGKTCGGSPDPASGVDKTGDKGFEELPTRCGPSLCPGTFNGQTMCVPCKSKLDPGSKEKAPTPVAPDQPGLDGVKGAETKETRTECDGATCTTTTTYRDVQGNKVGEKTQEKPKQSFCQENPNLSICKDGAFSGSCESGFSCDGDAIQCAMARKQHEAACKLLEDPPAELVATVQSLKGTGQAEGAFNETFSASAGFTPMPVAGCAVQDFPVAIGPLNLTVPLGTLLCPHLGTIRSVLSAFGALYFVMVVFVRGE